jgi:addiction module HigA family antidote
MAMHPGEFLIERFLLPGGISVRKAAEQLGVSTEALAEVISGQTPITVALAHALALAREFSYSRQWWLNLQRTWDDEQRLVA